MCNVKGEKMKTYLPIKVKSTPIRKLALIPFEKNRDSIYSGLELQYFNGQPYGTGYRVIAYRNDGFVDVYDDKSLYFMEDEQFHVTQNGLHKHVQTDIKNVNFCKVDNKQMISFDFLDMEERLISIKIEENTLRKSSPMNLLAPIGMGSKQPNYLPVFFLYEFDFIRRKNTTLLCSIGGKKIKIDKFPFPMGGQRRLYARYSNECEILEFANTDDEKLQEVELDQNNRYYDGNIEYIFARENVLQEILVHFEDHHVRFEFDKGLDISQECNGIFSIRPKEEMGYIQGEYKVIHGTQIEITMVPIAGWVAKPTSFITKKLFTPKSVFCSWSRKYSYHSIIDLNKKEIKSNWTNGNMKEK